MARGIRRALLPTLGCLVIAAGSGACSGDTPTVAAPTSGGTSGAAGASANKGGAGQGGGAGASGSAGTNAGSGGAGTASGGASMGAKPGGPCSKIADCVLPATTPAGCAEAECAAGKCTYRARDNDGDTHRASACKADDTTPITPGDDCNDNAPEVSPSAWDGPADGAKPNRCNDGVDQDCSGKADDGKTAAGATCTCVPGDNVACSEDENGKPITFPGGTPVGVCKRGAAKCGADGKLGPCIGARGPSPEICNGADDDCDGTPDNLPGVQLWFYDGDGDFHAAKGWKPVPACQQPNMVPPECNCTAGAPCPCDPTKWQIGLNPDDCDDTKASVYPGAVEACNAIDDNCNGSTDEGVPPSTEPCEVGLGLCKRAGTKTCEAGAYTGCSVKPADGTAELCDGIDNDCDGLVDNAPFGGKQVADAVCFECIPLGISATLNRSKGDDDFGGSVWVSTKMVIDEVGGPPNERRVRVIGVLEERQGDGTAFTYGGTQNIVAKRAIKRVLTQDALGTFGYGSNGFGGFQIPQLIELGQITDTNVHEYTVPLKAKTADGATYDVDALKLTVKGDGPGNDFPSGSGGSYVNPAAACIWVELEK